jgi:hypothetical protein
MKNRLWFLVALLGFVFTMAAACDYNKDTSKTPSSSPSAAPSESPATTLPPQNP